MKCPESDPGFWAHPVHGYEAQKELVCRVMRLVPRGRDVAIDVGAHIGVWSRRLALSNFHVHAFEPHPENFNCLRENTQDLNVRAYEYGVADVAGRMAICKDAQANSGMWHVDTQPREFQTSNVPMVTLDSQDIANVGLIKLDVEGYEGRVLLGAKRTIDREGPVIVFEDNGVGQHYFGDRWVDPKAVLRAFGYLRHARVRKDEIWLPA